MLKFMPNVCVCFSGSSLLVFLLNVQVHGQCFCLFQRWLLVQKYKAYAEGVRLSALLLEYGDTPENHFQGAGDFKK